MPTSIMGIRARDSVPWPVTEEGDIYAFWNVQIAPAFNALFATGRLGSKLTIEKGTLEAGKYQRVGPSKLGCSITQYFAVFLALNQGGQISPCKILTVRFWYPSK